METICNRIQENIAWDRPLDQKSQEHILSCPNCGELSLEYSNLTAMLDGYLDIEVPSSFTEQVMARIEADSKYSKQVEVSPKGFKNFFELDFFRLNLAYICGAVVTILGFFTPSAG